MKSNAFNETLNLGEIKIYFENRIKLDYTFYSGWADGVCYMNIDGKDIGYFDPYGLMSSVGAHIELCMENYKRFYSHKDFIEWYESRATVEVKEDTSHVEPITPPLQSPIKYGQLF